jgi:AraC family transcriptional regulator
MVRRERGSILGKIAVEVDAALAARSISGEDGQIRSRRIAGDADWEVSDVLCTSAPRDRPFEEEHSRVSVAMVVSGTFQYRSVLGRAEMTPGSLMLGNAGDCYECGHEHATGDRCIAFRYAPEFIEHLVPALGMRRTTGRFRSASMPPRPETSSLFARASTGLVGAVEVSWE